MKTARRITSVTAIAMMVLSVSPAIATAQTSVRGHGRSPNDPPNADSQISVNALLDTNVVGHGTVVWVGGVTPRVRGGPADPWLIDVTEIIFDGNTAHVFGVVVHSVFPEEIGIGWLSTSRTTVEPLSPTRLASLVVTLSPSSRGTSLCSNWSLKERQFKTQTKRKSAYRACSAGSDGSSPISSSISRCHSRESHGLSTP